MSFKSKFEALDGKKVRILKDNENSFTIIDPKSGENLKVYIDKDNDLSLKNPDIKRIKNSTKKHLPKKEGNRIISFFTKSSFNLLEMLFTICIVVVLSIIVITYVGEGDVEKEVVPVTNIEEDPRLTEFLNLYRDILNNYYDNIDTNDLLDTITKTMLDYLGDTYTGYLDIYEARNLQDKLNGGYKGYGIELGTDSNKNNVITEVFPNTPAEKVGLKVGDKILSIGGIDVTEKSSGEISIMIKDRISTRVEVVVERDGEVLSFNIEKDDIIIKSVSSEIIDNVGYIKIDSFSKTTFTQFEETLKDLEKNNISALVVDVRNNNGGYLNVAYNIADLFISKGKTIYKLETNKKINVYKANMDSTRGYKVAILINKGSASASEVFALAMKDSYGAIIVGENSYGKSSVQETTQISTGSLVKYTVATWLGPNDENIGNIGIEPNIKISNNSKTDDVLNKAIEAVRK